MAKVVEFLHRRPPYGAGERVALEPEKANALIKAGVCKPYDLEAAARASLKGEKAKAETPAAPAAPAS